MNVRYLCDGCASIVEMGDLDNMSLTTPVPRFCPLCGYEGIRKVKSALEWQSAKCIVAFKAEPLLIQLLFVEWRREPKGHQTYISYLREVLG